MTYDPFGNILSESNPSNGDRFKYTSEPWDSSIGLQYNLNRYYNPNDGRWVSQDPLGFDGGDTNLFRYVGNDSVAETDPEGLFGRRRRRHVSCCPPVILPPPVVTPPGPGGGVGSTSYYPPGPPEWIIKVPIGGKTIVITIGGGMVGPGMGGPGPGGGGMRGPGTGGTEGMGGPPLLPGDPSGEPGRGKKGASGGLGWGITVDIKIK